MGAVVESRSTTAASGRGARVRFYLPERPPQAGPFSGKVEEHGHEVSARWFPRYAIV